MSEDDEHDGAGRTRSLLHVLVDAQLVRRGRDARAARANGRLRPDDPGSASAVGLAAATCRIAISARLGYDPAAEELAPRCLPVLRARNLERELARCLCALGIVAVYRDVFPEAVAFLEEGTNRESDR